MKKVYVIIVCLAAMLSASISLKAQDVTITLMPGWTWISYPKAEVMDIPTALGDFIPMEGDIIKSQFSNSSYHNGQWRGSLQQFTPGLGYMYYSKRGETVTFVFGSTSQLQVLVTTAEPMLVTAISAMGGGEVTTEEGVPVLSKGLCWATHEYPTTSDGFFQEAGGGVGSFTVSMTDLGVGTTYYVRAYAVTPNGTFYGDQKSFTTQNGIPTITTADVSIIGSSWAYSGGNITDGGGLAVTVRGLCWSLSPNPTLADSHSANGSGTGSFTGYITGLSLNTTYYVRAYATNTYMTVYGNEQSFTTESDDDHAYVDLGLPSGTLWAVCNVGADSPVEYGDFFAWGETESKSTYNWRTYQYCNGSFTNLTKYCNNANYGYHGFTDNLTTLLPEDDAATANWGADWRTPIKDEWQELLDNTTCTWTNQNGVNGSLFTASNGNSLFLPAPKNSGSYGDYCSGSLYTYYPFCLWHFSFGSGDSGNGFGMEGYGERSNSYSVRALRCKNSVINVSANPAEGGTLSGGGTYLDHSNCTVSATANEGFVFTNWTENGVVVSTDVSYSFVVNGNRNLVANFSSYISGAFQFVDLGLPSGTMWATCNVGAEEPWEYGDYFAWGETEPKDYYDWNTYQYCNSDYDQLTKYCTDSEFGYNGFTDTVTALLPEDDAATANWGSEWRMPTYEECEELFDYTDWDWTTQNGVNGILFTATNGNHLFLPAAGYRSGDDHDGAGSGGNYWSCSLNTEDPSSALDFCFDANDWYDSDFCYGYREGGLSVRAVHRKTSVINVTANPAEGGEVSGGGTYVDYTSCTVSAMANEGYVFTSWTEEGEVVSTEATYSFLVNGDRDLVANFYSFNSGAFQYVDLGLPSGTIWATCNVGAEEPWEYGDYFAWGETGPKDYYDWSTYMYCNGSFNTLTKYCYNSIYGYNGFTDDLTILLPEDDAATVSLGTDWRMPTYEEYVELCENTTSTWTTLNGVNGTLFTASNGNCLFLPAAGYRDGNSFNGAESMSCYWSSSLSEDSLPSEAYYLLSGAEVLHESRSYGQTIRPVRSMSQNDAPTGAVNGLFSVSASQKVYFSQGNLQYQASTNIWRFAENQYDYIGNSNSNISQTYNGWIDLFGWGTSGWNSGNTYYHPWDSNNSNGYGPTGSNNLTGAFSNADWGVYNPISNGGNAPNQWRTLTQSEWDYVFNTRYTPSGMRYAKAVVNNVNGVILLPDYWSSGTYSLNNVNRNDVGFDSNILTVSQWILLEDVGAVFLPAAGNRNGTTVSYASSCGYYWSATCLGNNNACDLRFTNSNLSANDNIYRYRGRSVRLVCASE